MCDIQHTHVIENITTRKGTNGEDEGDRDIAGIRKIERQTQTDTQIDRGRRLREREKEGEQRPEWQWKPETLSEQQAGATPLPTRPLVPSYSFVQLGKRSLDPAAVDLELFKRLLVLLERLAFEAELL